MSDFDPMTGRPYGEGSPPPASLVADLKRTFGGPFWPRGRAIELLRKVHGGTWKYEAKANRYLHVESGRYVVRLVSMYDDDNSTPRLIWADSGEQAEFRHRERLLAKYIPFGSRSYR